MLYVRIVLVGLGLAVLMHRAVAETMPSVVINELMWMGSSVSSADEWIELRNTTDISVDVSGWSVTKRSGGLDVAMLTLAPNSVIPPGGIILISNYGVGPNSALAATPNMVTTDVALSNSALQIKLYDAAHTLIDTADDGIGNPLAGALQASNKIYASMERSPNGIDGTQSSSWHTATKSVGFAAGAVELGTPGAQNSNGRPVAVAGPDQTGVAGVAVNFDGSESTDPEQQPLVFTWDFGDGGASNEPTPTYVYAAAGQYTVTLSVSDGVDQVSDTLIVNVSPAAAVDQPVSNDPVPPAVVTSCRGLRLSAVMPNPVGTDEAESVSVSNGTNAVLPLTGCVIRAGSSQWKWPADATLAAGQILEVPYSKSHVRLTNAGGAVALLDANGDQLDATTYPAANEGARWIRRNGGWGWEPGTEAKPKTKKTAAKKTTKKSGAMKKPKEYERLKTLTEVQQYTSGDLVKVSGTVTVGLDAFGDHQAVIEDATAGCTIGLPTGARKFSVGDVVNISGAIRTSSGRRRIMVDDGGLKVIGHQELNPREVQVVDVGIDDTERLVKIHGTVNTVAASRFEVDDGTDLLSVVLKSSTRIVRPRMNTGDSVTVIGVMSAGTSGLRLYPRQNEDITVSRVLGVSTAPPVALPVSSPKARWWYWVLAGMGLLAVNAGWIWKRWRAARRVAAPAE